MYIFFLAILAGVTFGVTLNATSEIPYMKLDDNGSNQRVMFSLETEEGLDKVDEIVQIPQDIIVILDVSGSMGGDKIFYSRQAIQRIAESMRDIDYISFVTFSWSGGIVFESLRKSELDFIKNQIEGVYPSGSTNMYDGLLKAEEILNRIKSREETTKRIYLFSDGEEGITNEGKICSKIEEFRKFYGALTSGFGIGDYFNEKLMNNIAEFGGGEYFYIKDSDDISKVVSIAFSALQNIIGTDAKVYFHMKNGVKLNKVFGYYKDDLGVIEIGDLRASETRRFLIDVEIPKQEEIQNQNENQNDKLLILEYELKYYDLEKNEKLFRGEVSVELTTEESKIEFREKSVQHFHNLQKLIEEEEEIDDLIEAGSYDEAVELSEEINNRQNHILEDLLKDEAELDDEYIKEIGEIHDVVENRRRKVAGFGKEKKKGESKKYRKQKKRMNFANSASFNEL